MSFEFTHRILRPDGTERILHARKNSYILLQVYDNGKGIDPLRIEHSNSLGIMGMRERSQFLGGDVSFENRDGTLVTLKTPLNDY